MSKARELANQVRRLAFVPTGVCLPYVLSTPPTGWLFLDGRTIGSPASAATARANADCYALYVGLWDGMSNTEAPVTGGRGANAAADWAANKPIALPDHRGRVSAGKDNMGGTAANRLTTGVSGVNGAALGASGGSQSHALTAAQMPAHTHDVAKLNPVGGTGYDIAGGTLWTYTAAPSNSAGSGSAHPITQPTLVTNVIVKL